MDKFIFNLQRFNTTANVKYAETGKSTLDLPTAGSYLITGNNKSLNGVKLTLLNCFVLK